MIKKKAYLVCAYAVTASSNLLSQQATASEVYTIPQVESVLSTNVEVLDVRSETDVDTKLSNKATMTIVYTWR